MLGGHKYYYGKFTGSAVVPGPPGSPLSESLTSDPSPRQVPRTSRTSEGLSARGQLPVARTSESPEGRIGLCSEVLNLAGLLMSRLPEKGKIFKFKLGGRAVWVVPSLRITTASSKKKLDY